LELRELGNTGLKVSIVGFGGIPIQRVSNDEGVALLEEAKKLGINFIDTARGYTTSEAKIGNYLSEDRESWIVATKSMARDAKTFSEDIQISLKNLKVDYIDLYQFHNISTNEDYDHIFSENGAYQAALDAQEKGLINHIGITTHKSFIAERAVESGKFASIQVPFNAVEDQFLPAIKKASEKNIGVIVMKPLAGGALNNATSALKYILEHSVTVVIPGMQKSEEVRENAMLGHNFIGLADVEREELERVAKELGNRFCRRCEYCLPCPQGIKIPTNFIFNGYLTRYNLKEWAIGRYFAQEVNASACVECGLCESRCPYDLPIIEMLKEVENNFNAEKDSEVKNE
jgi:predicted aldo/keto reductase-like oxidoreductase